MEKMTVREILKATKGRLISGDIRASFKNISTDTRSVKKGDLFIALKGKNFDAHDFLAKAVAGGAAGMLVRRASCVVSRKFKNFQRSTFNVQPVVIAVGDTLRAMQDIANFCRMRRRIPVICVTGSNGKTTTKEIIWSILGMKFGRRHVLKNKGNFNNEVGVPLTLFGLGRRHKAAVLELGTNAYGEIRRLVEIARPTAGVVTNIGMSHIEGLKSVGGVAREKFSLIKGLRAGGTAVLNADDAMARRWIKSGNIPPSVRLVTYGISGNYAFNNRRNVCASDIKISGCRSSFRLSLGSKTLETKLTMPGLFNVYNALAGAAAGYAMGIRAELIKKGIESAESPPMRMEIKKSGGITIINDAYNANPSSVCQAVSFLGEIPGKRKILVLGDMLELGRLAVPAHRKISEDIKKAGVDILFTLGNLARVTAKKFALKGGCARAFTDKKELIKELKREARKGDMLLVKGSRKAKMEEVLDVLSSVVPSS
ncbi:UDP-N-acetylmuramoyl-tripeptide--D-alanyl-D-alanine ligase [Candidatus Desantisbacteria bacterium CG02_land_8_20_14_3_00_49_13]|nr:MAG: hypothetical protein AUJ67_09025 [Candidatus Desantisbacteria bacterium CG1_02_49_89]PIV54256.1 MAG: UDP-N-acetylmuramoyl-tripeptide--D-alanyl-D-alanine ligase [Candidatus Desantisbacteria bacterium CG02_land_8_20_14_3_00_49_13]